MNIVSVLGEGLERSSAGSRATSQKVISMCGGFTKALYLGDELVTPMLIKESGREVTAAFSEDFRFQQGQSSGLNVIAVQQFQLPDSSADYDLLWYNGVVEFDSAELRLSQLKEHCRKGGTVVYRCLCWLIPPSPDTKPFVTRRFGSVQPLDGILRLAKEAGFKIQDFYISPRSDWTKNYYLPLIKAAEEYAGAHESETGVSACVGDLRKELDTFELHCEEYSYVYYILKG